jgi:hypothetical protein
MFTHRLDFHVGILDVHKNRHDSEIKYFASLCYDDKKHGYFVAKLDTQKRRRSTVGGTKKQSPKKPKKSAKDKRAVRSDGEEEDVDTEIDEDEDEDEDETTSSDKDPVDGDESATAAAVKVNTLAWRAFQDKIIADNLANGFDSSRMPPPQKRSSVAMKSPRSPADLLRLQQEADIAAEDARRLEAINELVRVTTLQREKEAREARVAKVTGEAQLADRLARLEEQSLLSSSSSSSSSSSASPSTSNLRYLPPYAFQGLFAFVECVVVIVSYALVCGLCVRLSCVVDT